MVAIALVVVFVSFSIVISVAVPLQILKPKTSQLLQDIVLYGKTRGKRKTLTSLQKLEVPKR
jgi:hypothetical protein